MRLPPRHSAARGNLWVALILTIIGAVAVTIAVWPDKPQHRPAAATAPHAVAPRPVDAATFARLPRVSTWSTVPGAPTSLERPDGVLVHPVRDAPAFDAPGGPSIVVIPSQQPLAEPAHGDTITSPTWLPVIARAPGWVRVMLPSRPSHSCAWLPVDKQLTWARSRFRVVVDREHFQLTVTDGGHQLGAWRVGVGAQATPTPPGPTFVLAIETSPPHQEYSPYMVLLGTHSEELETYQSGPATTAIHGWPTDEPFGRASSHGCVRVPPQALAALLRVPAGTPVLIT